MRYFIYNYLSNMKLLRILSCQKITYLSAAKQIGIKYRLDMAKVQTKFQKSPLLAVFLA